MAEQVCERRNDVPANPGAGASGIPLAAGLTKDDPHYWRPPTDVLAYLETCCPTGARVLEIGPGTVPFRRADVYVDFVDVDTVPAEKLIKCDVARERLPFADKSFDFVVCRHMLEDMFNPFPVCEEMSRVAKAGYVETPSPLAEMCRGVDGSSPRYRGYHHHRFIVWAVGNELTFVSKYPIIEYFTCEEHKLKEALTAGARYWNTYYLWSGAMTVRHLQSPLDFSIVDDYPKMLNTAFNQSIAATDAFCRLVFQSQSAEPRSQHGA
jgi:hypothetical protein